MYEADTGGGASGEGQKPSATEVLGRYNGDAIRMAEKVAELERDNYQAREKLRDFKASLESAQKKVPAEGAVTLTPEEAKAWEAYRTFGQPDELKVSLEAGQLAVSERDALRRDELLERGAKAEGFRPGVLKILAKGLDIGMKEIDFQGEEGKIEKKEMLVVKTKNGEQENEMLLREYFAAQGDDVLSSLEAGELADPVQNGLLYPSQPARSQPVTYKPTNRYSHHVKKSE